VKPVETSAMIEHEDSHWWYRGRRRIVEDELEHVHLPAAARVLDAGCGSGRMLDALSRYGEVSGLDTNSDSVALARRRGYEDVHEGIVERLPWADETFDLITMLDVLEHTADDRMVLRELHRVSRPGGYLLVTVPAYQALWANHDVLNQHHRRYSRGTLRASALSVGWSVQRMTFFNSLLLAPAAAVRFSQRLRRQPPEEHRSDVEIGPEWLYPVLELPLRAEARWLRRGRTLPAGLSLLALLRRRSTAAAQHNQSPGEDPHNAGLLEDLKRSH
jgi:SAM-dependent methyltransferase